MRIDNAIGQIPYALKLGIKVAGEFDDGVEFELAADERFIGNPMARAYHGGIICGYMECAMSLTAMSMSNTSISGLASRNCCTRAIASVFIIVPVKTPL